MAYPAGVTVRGISFSGITDAEDGTEPAATNTRIIVSCNDLLIHTTTGRILLPSAQIFTGQASLPVTDQLNVWQDRFGKVLSTSPTHSYHVVMEQKFTVLNESRWEVVRAWPKLLLPAGAALDLDSYFDSLSTNYTTG